MYYFLSFFVSLFTLRYASLASLTRENFTGIANNLGYQLDFKIWIILISLYFFIISMQLFKKNHWHPSYLKPLSFIIMISINIAPWIPYKDNTIHLNALHVLLAMGASVLYIALIALFLNDLHLFNSCLYEMLAPKFRMLIGTLVILLLTYGNINSLIELVMTCGFSFFLAYASSKKIKKI